MKAVWGIRVLAFRLFAVSWMQAQVFQACDEIGDLEFKV